MAYATSKHALLGLTKHTAFSYGKAGIRCNAIMPGGMITGIGAGIHAGDVSESGRNNMMMTMAMRPDLCPVEDVADVVVWLCDSKSKIVNGALVAADNGWTCW